MTKTEWTPEDLQIIAEDNCNGMEEVIEKAEQDSQKTWYASWTHQRLFEEIRRNPARARIRAVSEISGNEIELFVCPVAPPVGKIDKKPAISYPPKAHDLSGRYFASYMSSLGQLGSCFPGEECQNFLVIERDDLNPTFDDDHIVDSENTVVHHEDHKTTTIVSLRALLKAKSTTESDDSWLTSETPATEDLIFAGAARKVNRHFGLQNILVNSKQDQIFRAPIDSQIVLLGAPGTGKTTTMTLRLKSKMYEGEDGLPDDEQNAIAQASELGMGKSWIIFTPTELLKQYVRNALDNQGLGELNRQMCTWESFSYNLSLTSLGFLRSDTRPKGFILNDAEVRLTPKALKFPIEWYEAFHSYRRKTFVAEFVKTVAQLSTSRDPNVVELAQVMNTTVIQHNPTAFDLIVACHDKQQQFASILKQLNATVDSEVLEISMYCNSRIPNLKNIWTDFLKQERLRGLPDEDLEDDENEIDTTVTNNRITPQQELKQTLRDFCHAVARSKTPSPGSKLAMRLAVLQKGLPDKEVARKLGLLLIDRKNLRSLNSLFKSYTVSLSKHYRQFKKSDSAGENPSWYTKTKTGISTINSAELDILILSHFRMFVDLFKDRRLYARYKSVILQELQKFSKMMVFIDECTDFSPIQLAAMNAMAFPTLRSVCACGDLNQRLTSCGITDEKALKWAIPGADFYRLKVSFRQTENLHAFGSTLLSLNDNRCEIASSSNEAVLDPGPSPVLGEDLDTIEAQANWAASRINEMLQHYDGDMPTTAIFVPTVQDVEPFADQLARTELFVKNNLRTQACRDGQAVGADIKICVYPIEHVKGLEFESCFFVSIDKLAVSQPELFDRYLYVGVTRASAFLGISSTAKLPSKLEPLRERLHSEWETT